MMDSEDMQIVSMQTPHLAQVERWHSRYSAASMLFKKSIDSGFNNPNTSGWAMVKGDEVLAVATVKLNQEHVGYLNCIVKPDKKRQGIGTSIVEYVLEQPEIKDLLHLHAAIDAGNIGAREILKEHDFTLIGNDSRGYLEYARHSR